MYFLWIKIQPCLRCLVPGWQDLVDLMVVGLEVVVLLPLIERDTLSKVKFFNWQRLFKYNSRQAQTWFSCLLFEIKVWFFFVNIPLIYEHVLHKHYLYNLSINLIDSALKFSITYQLTHLWTKCYQLTRPLTRYFTYLLPYLVTHTLTYPLTHQLCWLIPFTLTDLSSDSLFRWTAEE